MTNEEFWVGEPRLAIVFREKHEIENEMRNQELWIQGLYNYRAFGSVAESLALSFAGGKGGSPKPYPERPFPLSEREQKAELERNKRRTLEWVRSGQR